MKQAVDYVLADELTHVRFGSEWVKEFTKGDPDHLKRTQDFRREVDKQFSFGGARSDREDAAIPIAWEDRLEAGFTEEELEELREEIRSNADAEALMDEAGDLLFAAVNLVRHTGTDPETALRQANHKFSRRFRMVEQLSNAAGKTVTETDLDTLDLYWDEAKALEAAGGSPGNTTETA